jgi:hypothetical protein
VVKKDKVKRQEQRGDKQLEKPKKMPQQPSNPATQQPDDQIIHPFLLLVCALVAQQTTMGKHNNILFEKKPTCFAAWAGFSSFARPTF